LCNHTVVSEMKLSYLAENQDYQPLYIRSELLEVRVELLDTVQVF